MPITASQIKVYYASGQTALTGQVGSKTTAASGGNISITEVTDNSLNNLFADITGDEAAAGVTKYVKVFVKNTHGTLTWQNIKAWVSATTPGEDNEIAIGLAVSEDETATPPAGPAGVTFSTPTSKGAGLSLGNVAAGNAKALWIRWTVNPGATAKASEAGTVRWEGDTAA